MDQLPSKRLLSFLVAATMAGVSIIPQVATAQTKEADADPALKIYRASATKINDLVNTKLDVRFDYAKRYLYGKAWITLKPHFYATDSLNLDAKGMDIKEVAIVTAGKKTPLKYKYDGWNLLINLGRTFTNKESYTIYIDYTAKPDELKVQGSAAINDAKGLYFINPDGKDPKKPIQIWTQGETEGSSAWFPTIDRPNQKTTQEIAMTVENKYTTLSNGKLIKSTKNTDGTRTDVWKMDLPHAPYLFMMAIGEYAITKDTWRGKEVNYYVEKEYAPHAKAIFGNTPEMLTFFSKATGVDYPWVKYSQITAKDYVSGAMENTTATLHGDFVQKTDRELLDDHDMTVESVIAHELFHQWFGDYVTAESWSNLTVNESFADYSEYLWFEHKFGKDMADDHHYKSMQGYMNQEAYKPNLHLVRFHYHDKEDVFDAVTYQKGGRILNMLRNYVGDSAFFKSLNKYLTTNAFKTGEAHQLRLAFEDVTGEDLNWFWNQWYFSGGFPTLDINYVYDDAKKTVQVIVAQTQKADKVYRLPMAIDIYEGNNKVRHKVTVENKVDTFTFNYNTRPSFVNVDADKVLLATKTDRRDLETYIFQLSKAPNYLDRREAIEVLLKQQTANKEALNALAGALNDKFFGLRAMVINGLKLDNADVKAATEAKLKTLATNDPSSLVRSAAIKQLAKLKDASNAAIFEKAISDKSYLVAGTALNALADIDLKKAYPIAKSMEKDMKGALSAAVASVYVKNGNDADYKFFADKFDEASGQDKFQMSIQYITLLSQTKSTAFFTKGVDQIKAMADEYKNPNLNAYFVRSFETVVTKKKEAIAAAADNPSLAKDLQTQIDYLQKTITALKAPAKEN
ncbi:aminopeptidase N [Chitinophaga skermanii]|uniref:Aminopeptidase N n=1 Tax=Chitinophaga skermanii TaxID=331697 RepID=A0A327QJX0_9BACT|nr:M1 family aminopeptidase [Chitinophaga skermanii]RAJ04318.1 aminopeptidase N [Chitinophaga skermanii]